MIRVCQCKRFQSTPPARGATPAPFDYQAMMAISIHAPREGGDDYLETTLTDVD